MGLDVTPFLSVTVAPLVESSGGLVKRAVERAAAAGFRAVQLSAAQRGIRPRELDRTARRDLAALLTRAGVMLSGLDLLIPGREWTEASRQDRAAAAALGAIELAADLGRVPVSLAWPVKQMPADIVRAMLTAADARSVTLAIHSEDDLDGLAAFLKAHDTPTVGAALDPAALLAQDLDPVSVTGRFADRLTLARVDDLARASVTSLGGRVPVGEGDLNPDAYRATLSIARSLKAIVVELRDLKDPAAGMAAARRAWGAEE